MFNSLVSTNIVTLLISGGVITGITSLIKDRLPKIDPRFLVLGLSLILGAAYQAFISYVPVELQQSIVNFVVGSATFAIAIYEFITKNFKATPPVVTPPENLPVED